jgi:hypothetical protein
MTRYEFMVLSRVRRSLGGLPQSYTLVLQLFDKILREADAEFRIEDIHHDNLEKTYSGEVK